jgi:hypothetical protein
MKVLHIIAMAAMDFIFGLAFPACLLLALNMGSRESGYHKALLCALAAFFVWAALIWIYHKNIKTGRYTVLDAAKINLAVRLVLVPIYIAVFIICILFSVTGPFAIGIWFLAFLVDACILVTTNFMSIPCCVALRRRKAFNTGVSVLLFLCQFIFCIDVVVAIIYLVIAKSAENRNIGASVLSVKS